MPFDTMPAYGAVPSLTADWAAFRDYLCAPYKDNARRLSEIEAWFDDLYQRERDEIELTRVHATATVKKLFRPAVTRSFDAFCFNNQMYFSHDAAVLALPFGTRKMPGDEDRHLAP